MPKKTRAKPPRLDALPDTVDFRDQMYIPTLVEVPTTVDVEGYIAKEIPVLDQGREGACTGYGLATVVNYLHRTSRSMREADEVSAKMLYVMAKRYDEWPGQDYEGSSARGAMKGWHKHGVCARQLWQDASRKKELDEKASADALRRPLGAYFRVNHKDLVGMHSAITETGILFATCRVHEGWMDVGKGDKEIRYSEKLLGGHAFAIVAYDRDGFWIQNSWGGDWGYHGLARLDYSDWLENGSDVWVARLGAPIDLGKPGAAARMRGSAPRSYESYVYSSLRPHIVVAGNDGTLLETGTFGLTKKGLKEIITEQLPKKIATWNTKRVLLYAHGGLVSMDSALQYVANYREECLNREVYPVAFIWRSDAWATIKNILQDAISRRKTETFLDSSKDFMLDRLDDTLEPIARTFGGKALWDEMKENATLASERAAGAARMTAAHLVSVKAAIDEVHLIGHSAGSILLAPLAKFLAASGIEIASLSLWAPACTMELFNEVYRPLIKAGKIKTFQLYTLDEATEKADDCANIYHKSLLHLVSNAFEAKPRIPIFRPKGTPLLGLAEDARQIPASIWQGSNRWVISPQDGKSHARHHGDFDNDATTLLSTLEGITGKAARQPAQAFEASQTRTRQIRQSLETAIRRP